MIATIPTPERLWIKGPCFPPGHSKEEDPRLARFLRGHVRNGEWHHHGQPLHLHDGGFCVGHLGLVSEGRGSVGTNDPFNFFVNLFYMKGKNKLEDKPGVS